jgi:hypothetical protein
MNVTSSFFFQRFLRFFVVQTPTRPVSHPHRTFPPLIVFIFTNQNHRKTQKDNGQQGAADRRH